MPLPPPETHRCEQSGSVVAVEKEMHRQMDLQRRLLEFIRDKLDILDTKTSVCPSCALCLSKRYIRSSLSLSLSV